MSLDPAWRPAESETALFVERSWLVGMTLCAVAYGIVFTLFILSFMQLTKNLSKFNYFTRLVFMTYISVMFILATVYVASSAVMTQVSFVDARLFPGGPAAFQGSRWSYAHGGRVSYVVYVLANWLADGMVIFRYMIIYKNCQRYPFWIVMSFPFALYLASVLLSVLWVLQVSYPTSTPWNKIINLTTPYFWMSLSLNIIMTIAICCRLLYHRREMSLVLGPNHGTQYTTAAAIIVESSLIYTAFSLLFLIPFAINSPISGAFIQMLGEVQIIAPLLITYRVACGSAWAHDTQGLLSNKRATLSSGVRIQVDFSGPQRDACQLSNTGASKSQDVEEYAM